MSPSAQIHFVGQKENRLQQRKKAVSRIAWIVPLIWAMMFLFIKMPVFMIISGGIVGSVLLFIIVFAAIQILQAKNGFYALRHSI